MLRPPLSKPQIGYENTYQEQNETYKDNLDDFTLYLSDVSSHAINPIQMISLATIYGGFK